MRKDRNVCSRVCQRQKHSHELSCSPSLPRSCLAMAVDDEQILESIARRLLQQEMLRLEILEDELRRTQRKLETEKSGCTDQRACLQGEVAMLKHEVAMLQYNSGVFRSLTPLGRVGVLAAFGTQAGRLPHMDSGMIRHLGELVDDFIHDGNIGDTTTVNTAKKELEHLLSCNRCWSKCLAAKEENCTAWNTDETIAATCEKQ